MSRAKISQFEYRRADGAARSIVRRGQRARADSRGRDRGVWHAGGASGAASDQRPFRSSRFRSAIPSPPDSSPALARPGGNITGNTILGSDVVTKRLQILKDAIPSVSRVGYLWNPDNASSGAILQGLLEGGAALSHDACPRSRRERRMTSMPSLHRCRPIGPTRCCRRTIPCIRRRCSRVIDFLLKSRIPGLFQIRQNVADGGLMSYGASFSDLFRRGALYVDKILHGTKPGDLPIEQPMTFQLCRQSQDGKGDRP